MDDYKYMSSHTHQGYFDDYPEHEPASATGKSKECLVVSKQDTLVFNPLLVNPVDICKPHELAK